MGFESGLTLYELLDVAASQWSKIDSLWNFFLWIHLAILGGLIAIDRPVTIPERIIAMGIYCTFLLLNYMGLSAAYGYFEAIIGQINAYPDVEHADEIRAFLRDVPLDIYPLSLEAIYLTGIFATGAAFIFANSFVTARLRARAEFLAQEASKRDD